MDGAWYYVVRNENDNQAVTRVTTVNKKFNDLMKKTKYWEWLHLWTVTKEGGSTINGE